MKYTDEELLEWLKEYVIKCAQIAWAAGNKPDARIYEELLNLLGLHDKGEEMIRFPVYPGKLWVRYPAGSLKEIEVRVFEPGEVEKDFDSTLCWAEFEVKGFHDEIPEGASTTPTYLAMMNQWTELKNEIHRLEERNKYLEAALKNAGHVTTARKDQVKKAEHKADNMAHRVVGLEDRVRLLELQLQKAEAEKGFAERERDEMEKKNEDQ